MRTPRTIDPADVEARLVRPREMHRDAAVMRACRWDDVDLGHGYHEQPNLAENDRIRITISDAGRTEEVLRRFAEPSRQRYEDEQAARPTQKPRVSKGRAKAVLRCQGALALVDAPTPASSKTKAVPPPAKTASTKRTR